MGRDKAEQPGEHKQLTLLEQEVGLNTHFSMPFPD